MSGYGDALAAGFIALFVIGLIAGIAVWEFFWWLFRHLSFSWG